MFSKHLRALAVTAASGALVLAVPTAAHAAVREDVIRSGDGDTLRARFFDGQNGTGNYFEYWGSSPCTSTTTDADFSYSSLVGIGWNDRVESIQDFNSCDVKLYVDINFKGSASSYVNYGSTAKNVSSTYRNKVSSFRVS